MKHVRMSVSFAIVCVLIGAVGNTTAEPLSQEDIRTRKPFGIRMQLLGPTVIYSAYVDYFVGPQLNAEVGVGLLGMYIGGKYYFASPADEARWFPYAGAVLYAVPAIMSADEAIGGYVPLGIQYMANWGLTLSGEAAVVFSNRGDLKPYGALKAGFHF